MKKTKTLFEKTLSNLRQAWKSLRKNPGSHGLDGVTIETFATNLPTNLRALQLQLKCGFSFQKLYGRTIPKPDNKKRGLKISAVCDRVVLRSMLISIRKYFKKLNYGCSYGYIENTSREDAVAAIIRLRDKGYWHVLEADIQAFFDKVDQALLLDMVLRELLDRTLDDLLKQALAAEIGNKEQLPPGDLQYFADGTVGISQGGILSPLFANVYLSRFDKAMLDAGFNLIRYADDFIILCKTRQEALEAHSLATQILEKTLKLSLHPLSEKSDGKTKITTFGEGFDFLGFTFNHKSILPTERTRTKFRGKIETVTSTDRVESLIATLTKLRLTVLGWGHAYGFCHAENTKHGSQIMEPIFNSLDGKVHQCVAKFLKYCDLLPKGGLRGFHHKILGIPSLRQFLGASPLPISKRKIKKRATAPFQADGMRDYKTSSCAMKAQP